MPRLGSIEQALYPRGRLRRGKPQWFIEHDPAVNRLTPSRAGHSVQILRRVAAGVLSQIGSWFGIQIGGDPGGMQKLVNMLAMLERRIDDKSEARQISHRGLLGERPAKKRRRAVERRHHNIDPLTAERHHKRRRILQIWAYPYFGDGNGNTAKVRVANLATRQHLDNCMADGFAHP